MLFYKARKGEPKIGLPLKELHFIITLKNIHLLLCAPRVRQTVGVHSIAGGYFIYSIIKRFLQSKEKNFSLIQA